MNYPLLFQAVYFEPLCVEISAFQAVHAVLLPRIREGRDFAKLQVEATAKPAGQMGPHRNAYNSRRATKPGPTLDNNYYPPRVVDDRFYYSPEGRPEVAVVPIYGILAKNASFMEEVCMGITDINPAAHALHQATQAKDIKTIVLDVASPGGQVTGIREMAAAVHQATQTRGKTVYTFSDDKIASAAYWIGSKADEVYVTPSSTVGSIGTYLAWLDESVKMRMEGLSLEFFGAGEHKGMGLPGKVLTEKDRALLQGKVNQINGWFKSDILATRPKIADSTMQGQTFTGEESVGVRLADGVFNSWDEFLSLI